MRSFENCVTFEKSIHVSHTATMFGNEKKEEKENENHLEIHDCIYVQKINSKGNSFHSQMRIWKWMTCTCKRVYIVLYLVVYIFL